MIQRYLFLINALIFTIVALLHFLRVVTGWSLQVADVVIPMSLSWVVLILLGVVAYYNWVNFAKK